MTTTNMTATDLEKRIKGLEFPILNSGTTSRNKSEELSERSPYQESFTGNKNVEKLLSWKTEILKLAESINSVDDLIKLVLSCPVSGFSQEESKVFKDAFVALERMLIINPAKTELVKTLSDESTKTKLASITEALINSSFCPTMIN
jgi:hypothetical protein